MYHHQDMIERQWLSSLLQKYHGTPIINVYFFQETTHRKKQYLISLLLCEAESGGDMYRAEERKI